MGEVIFIQGGGEGAHEADSSLVASLERQLGADYKVIYPQMPHESDPDHEAWRPKIRQVLAESEGQAILVGHSVGGYILLKYLSQVTTPQQVRAICIIAAPYPGGDRDWQFEGFSLPENLAAKLPAGAQIFLYHSPDDQVVPFAHMALYAKNIPQAVTRETTGGHQLGNDLSVVEEDIRKNVRSTQPPESQ